MTERLGQAGWRVREMLLKLYVPVRRLADWCPWRRETRGLLRVGVHASGESGHAHLAR